MAKHDWALTLVIPITKTEVKNFAKGGTLSLRNPAAHFSTDAVSCRTCGASLDDFDTDCKGYNDYE